ncbi:MAG: hypothetical protein AAGE96_10250 [Cyanobacteria bacterium P01_G01_bin.19]
MNRVFTRDLDISVYRERSKLSSKDPDPKKLRLNSYPEISKEFKRNRAKHIVVKPLVETQNTLDMLEYFPHSKALWMYRHYKDFIQSNMKRFVVDAGSKALKAIAVRDPDNWRSQKVSDYVHSIVIEYYKPEINEYDATALFWFARNHLFYDLDLDTHSDVFMCRYEDLVRYPQKMVREIYSFMEAEYPAKNDFLKEINTQSVGKGSAVELSPEIEALCEKLLTKMNHTYLIKHPQFKTIER